MRPTTTRRPATSALKTADPAPDSTVARGGRRPRWPWVVLVCAAVGAGALGVAAGSAAISVTPNRWLMWVSPVQQVIATWAPVVGAAFLSIAAVVLVLGLGWRSARRRPRQMQTKVMSACAAGMRVPVGQLQLSRARWRWGGRGLVRAHVRYRPVDAVLADQSEAIAEALKPFVAAPVVVSWQRHRNRFAIAPRPVVPLRIEQEHPQMGKLAQTLAHIVGSLEVDQRRSLVNDDGSVQQLVGRYGHTTRDIGDGFRQRVQTVLDAKAPSPTGYWTVHWAPEINQLTVMPSEPLPTRADYPLHMPGLDEQMRIPLGVGDGGKVVCWRPDLFPHLLLVGPTGTGKTIFLFSLIISCLARGWILALVDPKELSFRGFDPHSLRGRGLPEWGGIVTSATTEEAMEDAIAFFHDNMRNRYAAIKTFEVSEDDLPPVLMIIDETGELVERLTEYHTSEAKLEDLQARAEAEGRGADSVVKPKGTKNPELRKIWSGLRLGRQAKDFVVSATQRPDVSFIPGEARSNLTTRVGLGHLDGAALEMVFNTRAIQQRVFETTVDEQTGQRRRTRIRGRATVDVGDGPQTIQTFFVPDPANAILGKLDPANVAVVQRMYELVETSRPRWAHQQEAPVITGRAKRAAHREFEQQMQLIEAEEVAGQQEVAYELVTESTVRAATLAVGDAAWLEVDGARTLVEIEEIEEDPFEPEDLQITYRIAGEGPTAGQQGVTSLDPGEDVAVPA